MPILDLRQDTQIPQTKLALRTTIAAATTSVLSLTSTAECNEHASRAALCNPAILQVATWDALSSYDELRAGYGSHVPKSAPLRGGSPRGQRASWRGSAALDAGRCDGQRGAEGGAGGGDGRVAVSPGRGVCPWRRPHDPKAPAGIGHARVTSHAAICRDLQRSELHFYGLSSVPVGATLSSWRRSFSRGGRGRHRGVEVTGGWGGRLAKGRGSCPGLVSRPPADRETPSRRNRPAHHPEGQRVRAAPGW
jgi:hypothetical protein